MEKEQRIISLDALRGFLLLAMIFFNSLTCGNVNIIPNWLCHFSEKNEGSGVTLVDFIFPCFVFVMGMSIPVAFAARKQANKLILSHIILRSVSLIGIGVLLSHDPPENFKMWSNLMAGCAILTFISTPYLIGNYIFKAIGITGLTYLTIHYNKINFEWWGILGLLGWAYLISALAFLLFKERGVIVCLGLLIATYIFGIETNLSFSEVASIGSICIGGILLSLNLRNLNYTLVFAFICSLASLLLYPLYGLSKEEATPSWSLISCSVAALLWIFSNLFPVGYLALIGQYAFFTYLLSEAFSCLYIPQTFISSISISLLTTFLMILVVKTLVYFRVRVKL